MGIEKFILPSDNIELFNALVPVSFLRWGALQFIVRICDKSVEDIKESTLDLVNNFISYFETYATSLDLDEIANFLSEYVYDDYGAILEDTSEDFVAKGLVALYNEVVKEGKGASSTLVSDLLSDPLPKPIPGLVRPRMHDEPEGVEEVFEKIKTSPAVLEETEEEEEEEIEEEEEEKEIAKDEEEIEKKPDSPVKDEDKEEEDDGWTTVKTRGRRSRKGGK
ncbi:Pre-rRNA-processing protein TSR2 like protein [Aduncisulcus paluster]|uniref:Pre-rRNA-processing protein TSR2 like protein n=1 Tax=Aduncisulcus paluster TaxID=2918883 RepID=A0ABQ5JY63_9EUKA|nr:Pre-rRNA-processing protein TSR2 like protein [Aduncisulcus paluster]